MLPNLPSFKAQVQLLLDRIVADLARKRLGVFSTVAVQVVHEGAAMRTIRADGSSDTSEMLTASAEMSMDLRSTATLSVDDRRAMLDDLAQQLAVQMQSHFFAVLTDKIEEAGQMVSGKNRSVVETIFETFEKIEMDFNRDGTQQPLSMAADSQTREKFMQAEQEIMTTPELRQQYEDLVNRKREAWRAREASRKLVG